MSQSLKLGIVKGLGDLVADRRRGRAAMCMVLVLAGGTAVSSAPAGGSQSDAAGVQQFQGSEPDVTELLAAQALAEDHGVSLDEALRRIQIQGATFDLAARYETELGSAFGGAFIDHASGGALVVLSTDLSSRRVRLSAPIGLTVRHRRSQRSMDDLRGISDRVLRRTHAAGVPAATLIRVESNTVELIAPGEARQSHVVTSEVADANGGLELSSLSVPESLACNTFQTICDPPLRGGLAMINGNGNQCSAGFNVSSATDGLPYILTAAHCLLDANSGGLTWQTRFPDQSVHVIGNVQRHAYFDSPSVDAGIIRVNNPVGWQVGNRVLVYRQTNTSPNTVRNEMYPITSVGSAAAIPNGYLCKTGMTSLTTCGYFLAAGADHPSGGPGSQDLGVVVMDGCQGDSGGPLYIQNRGYGMVSRGSGTAWTQTRNPGFGSVTSTCYPLVWYVGLTGSLAATNTVLRTS